MSGEVLFPSLSANDDSIPDITEIESLCMNCHQQGITRLLLTKIPHFKEVILSSFSCDHCGFTDSEVQSGGRIQEKGIRYNVTISSAQDLNRQVVKSENAKFCIPSLDFEQPPSGRSILTTVEGLLQAAISGLQQDQPQRKICDPDAHQKIEEFLQKLEDLLLLHEPFTFTIDDPSGNSFIENPCAPLRDSAITVNHYARTTEQDEQLGIQPAEEPEEAGEDSVPKDEVMTFAINCPRCNAPCVTNMKMINIPHFKEVVIMATNCDACGHRDNEVKAATGVEPKGKRIALTITGPADLTRDLLKSEMCGLEIPSLELSMESGSLGGKFTTLEGLLTDMKDQLMETNPFLAGDGGNESNRAKLDRLCGKLDEVIQGKTVGIDIILDDPTGNSYLQNLFAPKDDPHLKITNYERTQEQNEELGLCDMKVDAYVEDS